MTGVEPGRGLAGRQRLLGVRLLVQQQAAGGVRAAERGRRRRPRQVTTSPDRGVAVVQAGSIRSSSRSRRATASTSTHVSSRRRWWARGATRRGRRWSSCTAPDTLQNAHQVLVHLLPRVHVPPPARVARLRRARRGLPRQRRATDATGARPSTGTWAARTSTTSSTARGTWWRSTRSIPKRIGVYGGSYGGFITLMAMFTHARHLRRRRGAAAGHRLGALQPRLHRRTS